MDYPNRNDEARERLRTSSISYIGNYETDARCTQRGQVRRQSKVSAYSEHISGQVSIVFLLNPMTTFNDKIRVENKKTSSSDLLFFIRWKKQL